ncbi:MAG: ABC transporter substrate-binding protein, partial [Granulosicoccus sp.]
MFLKFLFSVGLVLPSFCAFADLNSIRFINDWKWEGQAAPLLLAADKGYFEQENLDVTLAIGRGSVDAIPKVASGEYHLGSADINSLIQWRDKNPDIDMKAVYIIYNS